MSKNYRLRNLECEGCGKNGLETELLSHYSGVGPYCDECIEEDDELNGYKFEPISF